MDITFNNGRLSVKLKDSPLENVLQEIMIQSGAKIWLNDKIDEKVTIEYKNIPVEEGVRRILKDKNYAFVYSPYETNAGKLSIVGSSKSKEIFADVKNNQLNAHLTDRLHNLERRNKLKAKRPTFDALAKDALENDDAKKRRKAIIALGKSRNIKAIEIITKALTNDADENVRLSAIDALLDINGGKVIESIAVALKDRDPWIRENAVQALGELGNEASSKYIQSALNDENSDVRTLAQEILEELEDEK
ncbi:MAG: HEAT repeat domain-containing protein [Candidatus Brocadiaceae bacterium]|nr:HEAT repeat domain-containing protein [Candidatus Brocadiaceae bacterium]